MTRFNQANCADWGIAVLRVVVGLVFLVHGSQKLFVFGIGGVAHAFTGLGLPLPMLSAALAMAAEFLGGLLLLLGFWTRWAAIPIAFNMLVAILAVHARGGFFLPAGAEYALTLMAAAVALALTGSGALSVDRYLASRKAGPQA